MQKCFKTHLWIRVLLFNLMFFVLLLVIAETTIRIFNPNYQVYTRTYPGQHKDRFFSKNTVVVNWPKKDDLLGWVCDNKIKFLKFSNKIYNRLPISYYINQQGFRCQTDFKSYHFDKSDILMLGDSFLFGVYLNEKENITSLLEDKFNNNFNCINLGIPGYGIDQMYLSYIKYNKTIKSKLIILFYIDEDIYRTYESFRLTEGMNKPSFDIKDEKLVYRMNDKPSIIEEIFEFSHLLNPLYEKYSHLQSKTLTRKIFEKFIQITKTYNQTLLIVRCPIVYQLINNDEFTKLSFKNMFNEKNFYYYELFEDLRKIDSENIKKMYFESDGHLTSYGTKVVSELIYQKIIKMGILTR